MIFTVGLGFGVALMDQLHEKPAKAAPEVALRPHAEPLRLTHPVQADATVQNCRTSYDCDSERQYYRGMRK